MSRFLHPGTLGPRPVPLDKNLVLMTPQGIALLNALEANTCLLDVLNGKQEVSGGNNAFLLYQAVESLLGLEPRKQISTVHTAIGVFFKSKSIEDQALQLKFIEHLYALFGIVLTAKDVADQAESTLDS